MKLSLGELYEKVDEILKENLGKDHFKLVNSRAYIVNNFSDMFCIAGIIPSNFTDVTCYAHLINKAISISREEKDSISTLTEKVIRRCDIIQYLRYKNGIESYITESEIEVIEVLSDLIVEWILPLEIFYSMEIKKKSCVKLYSNEGLYKYLVNIANFYLSYTNKYEKISEELDEQNKHQYMKKK